MVGDNKWELFNLDGVIHNLLNLVKASLQQYLCFLLSSLSSCFVSRSPKMSRPAPSRFELYNIGKYDDARHLTILPFEEEWALECPSRDKLEDITIFGTNTSGQLMHVNILWLPSADRRQVRARVQFQLRLDANETLSLLEDHQLCMSSLFDSRGNISTLQLGSLRLEFVFPFRTVRLLFIGFLRDDRQNTLRHVHLRAYWLCLGKVFDSLADFNVAWRKKQTQMVAEDRFEQWGQIKASVQVDDSAQRSIYLWGIKSKAYDIEARLEQGVTYRRLIAWSTKGFGIHLGASKCKPDMSYLYGHVNLGIGLLTSIEKVDISIKQFERVTAGQGDQPSKFIWVDCPQERRSFKLELFKPIEPIVGNFLQQCLLTIDGEKGIGLIFDESIDHLAELRAWLSKPWTVYSSPSSCDLTTESEPSLFVCNLSQPACTQSTLTGGKASSLAVLYQLSTTCAENFRVPQAVVLTVHALEAFLANNLHLRNAINFVESLLQDEADSIDLSSQCAHLVSMVESSAFPSAIETQLEQTMRETFGDDYGQMSFAVRSSACGEDTADMSAAGQMKTCLGVSGGELKSSILLCWASQFSERAVRYKHSYGQSAFSPMGVVVQEMVSSQVAGVAFTCDPLTGDQRTLTIAANYGLGESVVAAIAEPDTIRLEVSIKDTSLQIARHVKGVDSVTVGRKQKAVYFDHQRGQVVETEVEPDKQTKCCLDETCQRRLGEVCLAIQQHYGDARDIEWGVVEGDVYIFQARPVSHLTQLSDWELMHELDVGHNSERECCSRANLGEVYPGAISYSVAWFLNLWKQLGFVFWGPMSNVKDCDFIPYYNVGFSLTYNVMFFNLKTGMPPFDGDMESTITKSILLGMFGRLEFDDELHRDSVCKRRNKPVAAGHKLSSLFKLAALVLTPGRRIAAAQKFMANFRLENDPSEMSAAELFRVLGERGDFLAVPLLAHFTSTMASMIYNALVFDFVHTNMLHLTEKERIDYFSQLISSVSNVFSAQVPVLLKSVAAQLDSSSFVDMSDDEASQHLLSGENEASKAFLAFLAEYGHRGYKEFDPASKPWRADSSDLVRSIKAMLVGQKKTNTDEENTPSGEDQANDTDSMSSLSWSKRLYLTRVLLPLARRGISLRELGKNELIRAVDFYRTIYRHLGSRLVQSSRLPRVDLVFYLTFPELEQLVAHADASLVARATARMRIQSRKEALVFNETTYGPEIKPRSGLGDDDDDVDGNALVDDLADDGEQKQVCLHGVPVSSGRVIGRACVALSLAEAAALRPNDILITFSTDIGWSPYFMSLAGLVTEIGGLVSHGAVIAREYRLPALVGVHRATHTFATGDRVLLDTAAGIIVRLDEKEDLRSEKE